MKIYSALPYQCIFYAQIFSFGEKKSRIRDTPLYGSNYLLQYGQLQHSAIKEEKTSSAFIALCSCVPLALVQARRVLADICLILNQDDQTSLIQCNGEKV